MAPLGESYPSAEVHSNAPADRVVGKLVYSNTPDGLFNAKTWIVIINTFFHFPRFNHYTTRFWYEMTLLIIWVLEGGG